MRPFSKVAENACFLMFFNNCAFKTVQVVGYTRDARIFSDREKRDSETISAIKTRRFAPRVQEDRESASYDRVRRAAIPTVRRSFTLFKASRQFPPARGFLPTGHAMAVKFKNRGARMGKMKSSGM